MTSSDWHEVNPLHSIEPDNTGSDLFDGDILGDELIDIYNAAVVGGGDDDDMNEIPSLLAPASEDEKKQVILNHPGAPVDNAAAAAAAVAAAAIDDGLGAFRPSTSFNDLTTLLPTADTQVSNEASSPPSTFAPVAASSNIEQGNPPDTKKRVAPAPPPEVPAAKRRASPNAKRSSSTSKSKSKPSGGSAAAKAKTAVAANGKNNTPNPLTSGATAPAVSGAVKVSVKPIVKTAAVATSAVVTPRSPPKMADTDSNADAASVASTTDGAPPTEADFKSVAQAAVSNLIMNAGKDGTSAPEPTKIDTSTEHIKALTGSNWVTVCSGGDAPEGNASADKINNRSRRQNLTPDERARQNRDRNREHARNTRLRKKAYVEELKRTLTALVSQRDSSELEKRHSAQRELEQREVRFRVIEEFLKLRGRNEVNFARWAAILEDNFDLTLPLTEFREMAQTSKPRTEFEQVISGVSEAMNDSCMLSSFLQSLGKHHDNTVVSLVYNCDRKNFFMDNCTAVLDWTASTSGAKQKGANFELKVKGTVKAKFSPASNKLVSVAIVFDSGMVMLQLNQICKVNDNAHTGADAAAFHAASEADAILDSLQMPHIEASSVPANVTVVAPSGPASITDGEKDDSSDEGTPDSDETTKGAASRRVLRVRS